MPKQSFERIIDSRTGAATVLGGSGGGGGTPSISHSSLLGLGADDHLQYLTETRGDARYYTESEIDAWRTAHVGNPDIHHARAHSIISTSDHTATGLAVGNVLQATGETTFTWAALDHAYIINPHPDQHHARDHAMVGSTHTASGLSVGQVVRATGATTFAWQQLQHNDLGGVTPDQHHAQLHGMLDIAHHSYSGGAALDVFGLSAPSTLAKLTPSSAPGATAAILRTDSSGYLSLVRLTATDRVRTPIIDTASGALTLRPATDLILDPDSNLTKFVDSSSVQTNSFTSGFAGAGLRIDQGVSRTGKTTIETDDIYVRGRMHVYELLIHQIRATNGSVFVSSTGKAITVDSLGGSSYRIYVDPETVHGFSALDVIRAQRFTGSGVYQCDMIVSNPVPSASYFNASLISGDPPVAGMEFVRLGNMTDTSRQGTIYLTSDDSGAPYIDVVDGITSHADWNTAGKVKVRLGKLTGITGTANEYGFLAQNGTAFNSGSIKASSSGFEIQNANFRIFDINGNNQGSWTYGGITFPLLTNNFKTINWNLPSESDSGANIQGSAIDGAVYLTMNGSLGVSRTDGYSGLDMRGYESGPTLGETSYVRAGVRRVSGASRSYTSLMASQKHFLLGPAVCVSGNTNPITDPTAARAGLYFTNTYSAFPDADTKISEIVNDTGIYNALMLVGNRNANSTQRRVRIYNNLSINGAAFNESALNVLGTAEINAQNARPLRLTTDSSSPYALELYRNDTGSSVNLMNYDGNTLYVDSPLMLVESSATNNVSRDMLYMIAGADASLGPLTFAIGMKPSATGSNRKIYIGGGDASAMRPLILNCNGASAYGNVGIGMDSPTKKLHVAGTLIVDGDEGGVAGTVGFTDVVLGVGSGIGTVRMGSSTARESDQWLKVYFGTTAYYIPCWSNIS